jgi:hypothetical protein
VDSPTIAPDLPRARTRDLHAGVEDPIRVERPLHRREARERGGAPHARQQRRAQPAVAMLSRQRPAELGDERGHLVEQRFGARPPAGDASVDEGIDVDVRVAGVAEDDAADRLTVQRGAHAAHVLGKPVRRHAAVLDQLHRLERE